MSEIVQVGAPKSAAAQALLQQAAQLQGVGTSSLGSAQAAWSLAYDAMKHGALTTLDEGLTALFFASSAQAGAMTGYLDQSAALGGAASVLSADGKYIVIDVSVKVGASTDSLLAQLQSVGLEGGSAYAGVVSGRLPVSALGDLGELSAVGQAHASIAMTSAGSVQSQGVAAQRVDVAQSAHPSIIGTGVRVGFLSDSFDVKSSATTHKAGDITSGDLPTDTFIVQDLAANAGADEGRGMAQLAYDVAPGIAVDFATAFVSVASFANNIIALAQRGDKVIVDDVSYGNELMYQNGPIAQAVARAISQYGVTYFSSAANNGSHGWEGAWVSGANFAVGSDSYVGMNFGNGRDNLSMTVGANTTIGFSLQWDQPGSSAGGPGSADDLDVFLYSDAAMTTLVGSATSGSVGGDPVEYFSIANTTAVAKTYYIRVGYWVGGGGGTPAEIRLVELDNGRTGQLETTPTNINAGSVFGHNVGGGAIGTAAAFYASTPAFGATAQIESYSSVGFDKVTYSDAGVRLTTPIIYTPQITGVDGVDTTFFGYARDSTPYPNFSGTSAAAPDVAAVAALLVQANSGLTPADIRALLLDSALDMDNPYTTGFDVGFDNATGAGLVQADLAVNFALTQIISNSTQPALLGTHFADTIVGSALNNTLTGGGGNDNIDGGGGVDTAVFSGTRASYSIVRAGVGTIKVVDTRSGSPDGTDTLVNVERLQFSDYSKTALQPLGSDYDGQGRGDLLFRNSNGGGIVDWDGANSSTAYGLGGVGTEWAITTGDLDGDGRTDIIFRNTGSGQNVVWNGGLSSTAHALTAVDPVWKLLFTGDFDGDGKADLFFRNDSSGAMVIWKGGDSGNSAYLGGVGPEWQIKAGDFDGDGKTDLIFRNLNSGGNVVWDGGISSTAHALTAVDTVWSLAAVGDFDGDGKADLAFLNTSTGAVVTWSAGNSASAVFRGTTVTNAQVLAGDFNGDGYSDLFLRNPSTGALVVWDGAASSTAHTIGGVGSEWQIFG